MTEFIIASPRQIWRALLDGLKEFINKSEKVVSLRSSVRQRSSSSRKELLRSYMILSAYDLSHYSRVGTRSSIMS